MFCYEKYFCSHLARNVLLRKIFLFSFRSNVDVYLKPHLLRTYDFCWCDKDLAKRIDDVSTLCETYMLYLI